MFAQRHCVRPAEHKSWRRAATLCVSRALGIALIALAATAFGANPAPYRLAVDAVYPHDPTAFTQGLLWADGRLYESTGRYGQSSLRRVELATGAVERRRTLPARLFAEGLAKVGDRLIQLTWKAGVGLIYNAETLAPLRRFHYPGEGWGLTFDGRHLIQSDGSADLQFLDPDTLMVHHRLTVTYHGVAVTRLNELEYIRGEIWANIYPGDTIARIDPTTGAVIAAIDASGLRAHLPPGARVDVLNGIAYDAKTDRIFVTGKLWPRLFEVRAVPAR